ncbi:hypothetical protein [Fusibacter bizertensis]
MSISPVSSSISPGYDNTEVQNLKQKSLKEELGQKNGSITEKAIVESKKSETKSVTTSEDSSVVGISAHGDTVEISKQGISKAQDMTKAQESSSTEQLASMVTASAASSSASAQAAVLKSVETEETEDTESSSTSNLSSDSEYELKQKLANGTITRAQYDDEIMKRGNDTEPAEA